jgi:hypothetical protein
MKAAARRALNSPAPYAARGLEGDNILNGIAYPELTRRDCWTTIQPDVSVSVSHCITFTELIQIEIRDVVITIPF